MDNKIPITLPLGLSPPGLADFVVGQNRELLAALAALAAGTLSEQAVYVWGESGGGKTHLLRAALSRAKQLRRLAFFCRGNDVPPPMAGLLVTDDIHLADEQTQIAVFDWFNVARQSRHYSILASGNAPPSTLPLREELTARLGGGLVFQLQRLSDADKMNALIAFAARHCFTLPGAVADLLLTRLPRDMGGLTAALSDLDNFLLAEKKPLTTQSAHRWLNDYRDRIGELL